MQGIKSRPAVCKASVLCTALSLWPQKAHVLSFTTRHLVSCFSHFLLFRGCHIWLSAWGAMWCCGWNPIPLLQPFRPPPAPLSQFLLKITFRIFLQSSLETKPGISSTPNYIYTGGHLPLWGAPSGPALGNAGLIC